MKITPSTDIPDLLRSDLIRSTGLHMSDIYGALYHELNPKRYTDDPWNELTVAMGTAWEKHVEWLLISQGFEVSRPAEFQTAEGIAFSPDLLVSNGKFRLGEIKLTWMSSKEDLTAPKFDKYLTQIKAYCYHLETPYARLYVAHVNGEGGFGKPNPQLKAWDIEFSGKELAENWVMLLNYAKRKGML